jgi:1,2-phenylacetyl-CoA epoxidase catalytic subunit
MVDEVELDEPSRILSDQVSGLAYRALATAHSLGSALRLAPTLTLKRLLVQYIAEELRRFEAASDLYQQLRPGAELMDAVGDRLSSIRTPESWLEVVVLQFVFDRAGELQLKESMACAEPRLARLATTIVEGDRMHAMMGSEAASALRNTLLDDPELAGDAQRYFDHWLGVALRSFGRPGTERSRRALELGLKRRDSAEVIREFLDGIDAVIERIGLRFPTRAELGLQLPEGLGLA